MKVWDGLKKSFDSWENNTAQVTEQAMRSRIILAPSGAVLSGVLQVRAALDRAVTRVVSTFGLATRQDQERTLHALNQLQSRIMDLEERLAEKR